jgi:hypothetical protein
MPAARPTLNMPQPNVPAVSSDTAAAIDSPRDSRMSPALASRAPRSEAGSADHSGRACVAPLTAALTSGSPAAACVDRLRQELMTPVAPDWASATAGERALVSGIRFLSIHARAKNVRGCSPSSG